jgi:hypothetical protein
MNESIREWFRYHTDFLYTLIYKDGPFYLDFWSLVHAWSAIILFTLFVSLGVKRRWFWFVTIIIGYEIIEVLFIYFALHIFRPERFNDQIMDIIVGIGVAITWYYILSFNSKSSKTSKLPSWFFRFFSSATFSFVWVGNYHYQYNLELINTKGLNIWAFSLWLIGGYLFLILYDMIKRFFNKVILRFGITWVIYFILLLIIEFTGYYILGIKEVSAGQKNALIFGLVHGTMAMHIYYLLFPFFIISFYEIFRKQTEKAQLNLIRMKNEQAEYASVLEKI